MALTNNDTDLGVLAEKHGWAGCLTDNEGNRKVYVDPSLFAADAGMAYVSMGNGGFALHHGEGDNSPLGENYALLLERAMEDALSSSLGATSPPGGA